MNQFIANQKKKVNNNKGFTLIELIVVIAILGILAAIAIPRLGGFRDDAESKAQEANYRTVESAVQMYIAQTGAPAALKEDVDLSTYLNETKMKIKAPGTTEVKDFAGKVDINANGSWVVSAP